MRTAVLICLDGLFHQRPQRAFAIVGSLVQTNDVFVVGLDRIGNFHFERLDSHGSETYEFTCESKVKNQRRFLYPPSSDLTSFLAFERGPNSSVPMRTIVAPSSTATSKSLLMPMLKCGNGAPKTFSHCSFNSRSCRKTGRTFSRSGVHGAMVINP